MRCGNRTPQVPFFPRGALISAADVGPPPLFQFAGCETPGPKPNFGEAEVNVRQANADFAKSTLESLRLRTPELVAGALTSPRLSISLRVSLIVLFDRLENLATYTWLEDTTRRAVLSGKHAFAASHLKICHACLGTRESVNQPCDFPACELNCDWQFQKIGP